MKTRLLCLASVSVASLAFGQIASTATVTRGNGAPAGLTSGSADGLAESSGPKDDCKGVTYLTKSGKVIAKDEVRIRIKVGDAIHIHYSEEGIVDQVVVDVD
jgi:hypothetical protein